jgi:bacillithiol biosynthesis cysteine-adding enzyme BshC
MITQPLLKTETLKFHLSKIIPALTLDYLEQKEKVRSFYNYPPHISSFEDAVAQRRQFPFYRKELVNVLLKQNHQLLDDFPAMKSNITALLHEDTFTVTTGHQLCIFTGPLYFIYKIISAVNLAETLNEKHPALHFVPVYWMAAEDHDFEEINHIHLFGKKLSWNTEAKGAAGELDPETMNDLLAELKVVMGDSANAKELYRIFEDAYMFNASLADATRFLVTKLFGKFGLVILDGNESELKNLFKPVLKDELTKQSSFTLVEETNNRLVESGYKLQVNPRSINLFFMEESLRERIVKAPDGHFEVVNTDLSFTEEMMLNLLEKQPERFSPNVVLRPLFEEYILPNVAYVGGPGELSYWLQYRSMFEYHKVHYPVLVLRESVLIIDQALEKKLNQFRMSTSDLFLSTDELIKNFIREEAGDFDVSDFISRSSQLFTEIRNRVTAIDQTLAGTVNAEEQKLLNSIDTLKKKVQAAVRRQHESSVNQIKGMKEKIFPEGVPQERQLNFIPFYLQNGERFISILKNELRPFRDGMLVLSI